MEAVNQMLTKRHDPKSRRYLFFPLLGPLLVILFITVLTSGVAMAGVPPRSPVIADAGSSLPTRLSASRPLHAARNGLLSGRDPLASHIGRSGPTTPTSTPICVSAFSIVPSPNHSAEDNALYSVAALGPDDIWAVGIFHESVTSQQPLTE